MLPDPLHPVVVHFPIVFVVILPIAAISALIFIRRDGAPARAWAIPVALAAALSLSAFAALRTGAAQEERVEAIVPETALNTHEEAAERFFVLSLILLGVAAAGLTSGTLGRSARIVATLGALGLVVAGIQVGGSGGELVYRHHAAAAYGANADPLSPSHDRSHD